MTVATPLSDVLPEEAVGMPEGWRWTGVGRPPESVVSPGSAEEASTAMRWAGASGVLVVAAGTSRRFGAAEMTAPFVVLTSKRLQGLEIYEPADLTLTAGAGTRVADIGRELARHGQWLPFDPPSVGERSLGGLVSSGDSGPLWTGYGALRNHVLGMTVVAGDGRPLHLGGRVVKNVAGFDLLKALVGGGGTLGFITSVCVRTFPRPDVERVLSATAPDASSLVEVALAVGTAPVLPASVTIEAARGAPATLNVRLHGAAVTVEADAARLAGHAGIDFEHTDRRGADLPAELRAEEAEVAVLAIVTVLPDRLQALVPTVERLEGLSALSIDTYSARLRIGLAVALADPLRDLRRVVEELGGALAIQRGPANGTLDGIGSRPSPDELRLQERVTRVFDPGGVLWRPRR